MVLILFMLTASLNKNFSKINQITSCNFKNHLTKHGYVCIHFDAFIPNMGMVFNDSEFLEIIRENYTVICSQLERVNTSVYEDFVSKRGYIQWLPFVISSA